MKIKVRTLRNESVEFDVDPSESVGELKGKIEGKLNHPKEGQRLIYSGKILTDAQSITSTGIKENEYIVLYLSKQPSKTVQEVPEKKNDEVKEESEKNNQPDNQSKNVVSSPSNQESPKDEEFEKLVTQVMDMGFERTQVVNALNASQRNPEVAVQFLLSGQMNNEEEEDIDDNEDSGNGSEGVFDFLKNSPQFESLRAVIQNNPQLLSSLLQDLAASNPALLQLITQHQDEFIKLLQEPVSGNVGQGLKGQQPPPPGTQVVQVTQEEKAAIERLCNLGFTKNKVLEAFLACDRDEQMAANYLLENLGDDDHDF